MKVSHPDLWDELSVKAQDRYEADLVLFEERQKIRLRQEEDFWTAYNSIALCESSPGVPKYTVEKINAWCRKNWPSSLGPFPEAYNL